MLNSSPEIAFLPENSFLRRVVFSGRFSKLRRSYDRRGLAEQLESDHAFERLKMNRRDIEACLSEHDGGVTLFRRVVDHWGPTNGVALAGDKDPRLVEFIPSLSRAFPDAFLIHIYRDPRDVALSKTKASWSKDRAFIWNVFGGRVQLDIARRAGAALFGERYLEVRYETLLNDPETVIRRICQKIDLRYDANMMNPALGGEKLVASNELDWKRNSLKPVDADNRDKWKNGLSAQQAALVERSHRAHMQRLNYAPSTSPAALGPISRLWVAVQSATIAILAPVYLNYRLWTQSKSQD